MIIVVLIAAGTCVVTGALAYVLYYQLTRAKGQLFAARQELSRTRARHEAATRAAQEAQQRCAQALNQLENALTNTSHALDIADQIGVVSVQLSELVTYMAPEEPIRRGRHIKAVPEMIA
jgi:hypothetical protein